MADMITNYQVRCRYFAENYSCVFTTLQLDEAPPKIIEPDDQICRFCGKMLPEVTFGNIAHAIPELMGNKDFISLSECDNCNRVFSKYENNLDSYLGMSRVIMQTDGKSGVPDYVAPKEEIKILMGKSDNVEIHVGPGSGAVFDEENKEITLPGEARSFIPIAVYKSFVKSAISLMPYPFTRIFAQTRQWLITKKADGEPYWSQTAKCFRVFVPGAKPFRKLTANIYMRNDDSLQVPYCIAVIAFDNLMFQYIVPCPEMDSVLNGKTISMYLFPHPFDVESLSMESRQHADIYGKTTTNILDLSGKEKMRHEQSASIKFSSSQELFSEEQEPNNKDKT